MAKNDDYILGLDIGSTKISAVIGRVGPDNQVELFGTGSGISAGVHRGRIKDRDELFRGIERAVHRARREAGVMPSRVLTTLPLHGTTVCQNVGFLLTDATAEMVTDDDKIEVIKRAKNVAVSSDQTLLHAIPLTFKVDGETVEEAIGLPGSKLECSSTIVLGDSTNVQHIRHVLRTFKCRLDGLIFDPLATAQVMTDQSLRQAGVLVLDVGGRFSKLAVFRHNALLDAMVVPIGGETITSDIAQCLNVSIPEAERLKIGYADVMLQAIDSTESIEITTRNGNRERIQRRYLCQIIEARIRELGQLLLPMISNYSVCPHMVLVGGSSALTGLSVYWGGQFSRSIQMGQIDQARLPLSDPHYMTAMGTLVYAARTGAITAKEQSGFSRLFHRFFRG